MKNKKELYESLVTDCDEILSGVSKEDPEYDEILKISLHLIQTILDFIWKII